MDGLVRVSLISLSVLLRASVSSHLFVADIGCHFRQPNSVLYLPRTNKAFSLYLHCSGGSFEAE